MYPTYQRKIKKLNADNAATVNSNQPVHPCFPSDKTTLRRFAEREACCLFWDFPAVTDGLETEIEGFFL